MGCRHQSQIVYRSLTLRRCRQMPTGAHALDPVGWPCMVSLLLEGTFPFLVWTRLRLPLVLLMITLHVVITVLFCKTPSSFLISPRLQHSADLKQPISLACGQRGSRSTGRGRHES